MRQGNQRLKDVLGAEPRTPLDLAVRETLTGIGCIPNEPLRYAIDSVPSARCDGVPTFQGWQLSLCGPQSSVSRVAIKGQFGPAIGDAGNADKEVTTVSARDRRSSTLTQLVEHAVQPEPVPAAASLKMRRQPAARSAWACRMLVWSSPPDTRTYQMAWPRASSSQLARTECQIIQTRPSLRFCSALSPRRSHSCASMHRKTGRISVRAAPN